MAKSIRQFDRHVDSVLAALNILDCFLENPKLSILQIIDATKMTRNRVTRIIGTLMYSGYIMEDIEKGIFTPGPKLMVLGKVFESNQNLVALTRPILRQLALKTGESATLYIREGHERVVLVREEGTQAIRFSVAVGQRMDLHAGAAGKLLLAYAPESERDIILSNKHLKRFTSQTITESTRLLSELKKIRKAAYAVSKGERNPDSFSLAAPVFEHGDHLIGALAIAGPISRFTPKSQSLYLSELLQAARLISDHFSSQSIERTPSE